MATYIGTIYRDEYYGSAQNVYGIDADDTLSPSANKSYFIYGGNGNDLCIANNYNDEIYGGAGRDDLRGYGGNDEIEGGSGGDEIRGDYGNDNLWGGSGPDSFFFDSKLNAKQNVDFIHDFTTGSDGDLIVLNKAIFKGTGNPNTFLASSKFEVGSQATDPKTRIVYNKSKGTAYFDPDGSKSAKQTEFLKIDKGLSMSAGDFFIIES